MTLSYHEPWANYPQYKTGNLQVYSSVPYPDQKETHNGGPSCISKHKGKRKENYTANLWAFRWHQSLWGPLALQGCCCKCHIEISYTSISLHLGLETGGLMSSCLWAVFVSWCIFEVQINASLFVCIRPNLSCLGPGPGFLFLYIHLWQP